MAAFVKSKSATEKALAVRDAFQSRVVGHVVRRGQHKRLIFDELPVPVLDKNGTVIGVSVMVRLFEGPTEIRIDPHRVIINPPLVPRANLTYEEFQVVGGQEIDGVVQPVKVVPTGRIVAHSEWIAMVGMEYRRIVGLPDPEAALVEAVWDSIELTPNAKGWRARGTVTTVYATAPGGNGSVQSNHATSYATARTGGTLTATGLHLVGQGTAGAGE